MTVGIAVRSEGMIILVSDRMITSGDIEFEPDAVKINLLTTSIAVMFSGDSSLHAEVIQDVIIEVNQCVKDEPNIWLNVRDVANLYIKHWNEARFRRAEHDVLAPLGLTRKSYLDKIVNFPPAIIDRVMKAMSDARVPGVEVIVAGIDQRFGKPAPSIYHVADGYAMCADQSAFAAIGSGARHAESQMMLAKYSSRTGNGEALLLAYSAKRGAEIAPGVGNDTDILVIGPGMGQCFELPADAKEKIESEYQTIVKKDRDARVEGFREIDTFLASQTNASQKQAVAGTAITIETSHVKP
jgi:20S proteasome alpha/beta subunit